MGLPVTLIEFDLEQLVADGLVSSVHNVPDHHIHMLHHHAASVHDFITMYRWHHLHSCCLAGPYTTVA